MAYTKGEWFPVQYANFWEIQIGRFYGDVSLTNEESCPDAEANAKLMAAAPDLLEALKEVVRISDRKHIAWDKAKEAIFKATT